MWCWKYCKNNDINPLLNSSKRCYEGCFSSPLCFCIPLVVPLLLFFLLCSPMTVVIYYISAQGIIVVFDDSTQSISLCFGSYLGGKTSCRCSIDLSKHRSVTIDNPYENPTRKSDWLARCCPYITGFCCVRCHLFSPLLFPQNRLRREVEE